MSIIKMNPNQLRDLLRKEQETQTKQWFGDAIPLKELRNKGIIIHPIIPTKKRFGYGDYPVVQFSCSYEVNSSNFKGGAPIALFHSSSENTCNGNLLYFQEGTGEVLLFTDDFPEWLHDGNVGLKAIPDAKSFDLMHGVLKKIENDEDPHLSTLFKYINGDKQHPELSSYAIPSFFNTQLNPSQQDAVKTLVADNPIGVLHGPPGTGKTTTLIEVTLQLIKQGKKVAVCAPSNAAVDHFASGLLSKGVAIFRMGNTARIHEAVWSYTIEGTLAKDEYAKPLKKLKIQADEYRKLAGQYKRNFGKDEREQRKLLYNEWKAIRKQLKDTSDYYLEKALTEAQVILGTPIGLRDSLLKSSNFDVVILDEAGQCLLPLAWVGLQIAPRMILGGDPYQLPPTVIDDQAAKEGLSTSILEQAFNSNLPTCFLDTQYRMPPAIAAFSSEFFYEGKLKSEKENPKDDVPIQFFDTAGADYNELFNVENASLTNIKELNFIQDILGTFAINPTECILISPYAAQVQQAKKQFPQLKKISTIDAFQGQEANTVFISLVRSNTDGKIGFLKDYRRMNVALTRAQQQLFIIGDSATLGNDEFYGKLISYIEEIGGYHSVFEYTY